MSRVATAAIWLSAGAVGALRFWVGLQSQCSEAWWWAEQIEQIAWWPILVGFSVGIVLDVRKLWKSTEVAFSESEQLADRWPIWAEESESESESERVVH